MKKFSVIIHSRERVTLLENLLISIQATTTNKADIEVIVAYDFDDTPTAARVSLWSERFKDLSVQFHGRVRSKQLNKDYINWMTKNFTSGKYIWGVNDDVLFQTPNWDVLAWDLLEAYLKDKPDGVVYGQTDDGTLNKPAIGIFSCFPIISKVAADAMGGFFDDEFWSWNADIAVYYVYERLGRIIDLRDTIKVEHLTHHHGTNKRAIDSIGINMRDLHNECGAWGPDTYIGRDVERITKWMDKFK